MVLLGRGWPRCFLGHPCPADPARPTGPAPLLPAGAATVVVVVVTSYLTFEPPTRHALRTPSTDGLRAA
ncbi:hypothetical protein [Streptomyces sp. NPDC006999]|uniref:hypothetical protein n=1 Tax=unclassified Streptomyces TaxID=2593676 RepID=UPI0034008334